MELTIKTINKDSIVYRTTEFLLNGILIADYVHHTKRVIIYDAEKATYLPCKTLHSAITQVLKFHKKNL